MTLSVSVTHFWLLSRHWPIVDYITSQRVYFVINIVKAILPVLMIHSRLVMVIFILSSYIYSVVANYLFIGPKRYRRL